MPSHSLHCHKFIFIHSLSFLSICFCVFSTDLYADHPANFEYWRPYEDTGVCRYSGYGFFTIPPGLSFSECMEWAQEKYTAQECWVVHDPGNTWVRCFGRQRPGSSITFGARYDFYYEIDVPDQPFSCHDGSIPVGRMCPGDDPEKQKPCCPALGNPVNIATGEKAQVEADYQGTGPFPLTYTRTYARDRFDAPIARAAVKWRHNYESQIYAYLLLPDIVGVYRADGQRINFFKVGGEWVSNVDITLKLQEVLDGGGSRIGWTITANDNSIETYDADGKLSTITNKEGLTQVLSYTVGSAEGGDDNPHTLDRVTGPFGRTLAFTYNARGYIDSMVDPDGGVYTYSHDLKNNLISVSYPDDTPANETDNTRRLYHYEDQIFVHALTGITDENGTRFASWGFDAQGRAIYSEHAGGAERFDFTYNADGSTSVTDALGNTQTYLLENLHGVKDIGQIDGGPCSACGGQYASTTYDANGFVASRTDFNGNTTTYINNDRGLETSRTEAVGTALERTITTEWHPDFRLPVKITEPGKETYFTYDSQGRLLSTSEVAL